MSKSADNFARSLAYLASVARAACILAAQCYRNAGDATMAAHWRRRATI